MSKKDLHDWLCKSNWCVMPYTHINIDNNGDYLLCCASFAVKDKDGVPLNIKDYTIEEMWNHPARQHILKSFNANERHPACERCWREDPEYSNRVKFSENMYAIDYTEQKFLDNNYEPDSEYPLSLEIRPGNICNLKCRICTVRASSQWTKDTLKLWYNDKNIKDTPLSQYNKDCQWFDDDKIWNEPEILQKVKLIHFLGGEPFMADKHFILLDKLTKILDPATVTVKYNTNGTIVPNAEQIAILKKYGRVEVAASIDDMGKRFEYQRKNAVWKEVEKNIDLFYQHTSKVSIDCAYSIFNGYNIDDYFNFVDSKKWRMKMNVDHFVRSTGIDLRSLNKKEKDAFYKKLKAGTNPRTKYVIEFMMSADLHSPDQQHMRYKLIQQLDGVRNERFFDVYPELEGILDLSDSPQK